MLQGTNIYYQLRVTKLKNWCCILLVMLMLVNVFSPITSLIMFHINFEKHLEECQHHHHHGEDCQARCILKEMMSAHAGATPENAISFVYFTDLFLLDYQLIQTNLLKEVLIVDIFSHYLMLYSPPVLRMHSPPPKLY